MQIGPEDVVFELYLVFTLLMFFMIPHYINLREVSMKGLNPFSQQLEMAGLKSKSKINLEKVTLNNLWKNCTVF